MTRKKPRGTMAKRKRKKGSGGEKGRGWERLLARTFSLWWSGGESDCVFHRSDSSGARATSRAKLGRKTGNSHGDLSALDPSGSPFLKMFTVEFKRGYSKHSFADLLDCKDTSAVQEWGKWIAKAERDRLAAGSLHWAIVSRRDQRQAIVAVPWGTWFPHSEKTVPFCTLSLPIKGLNGLWNIRIFRLDDWFSLFSRNDVEAEVKKSTEAILERYRQPNSNRQVCEQ
jgi:hypothetical protein